jgi:hypothetical protein
MRRIPAAIFLLSFALLAAALGPGGPPVGVYRSAAQYRQQKPAPAGDDVRVSEKRGGLIVTRRSGPGRLKTIVPLDSAWGYVNGNGRSFRLFRGQEYQIQQADTLTIYSSLSTGVAGERMTRSMASVASNTYTAQRYFFSRGLTGLIFPLNEKNLRLAYEASNPAFVSALKTMGFTQSLSDYDAKAGSFRVVQLYRQNMK